MIFLERKMESHLNFHQFLQSKRHKLPYQLQVFISRERIQPTDLVTEYVTVELYDLSLGSQVHCVSLAQKLLKTENTFTWYFVVLIEN